MIINRHLQTRRSATIEISNNDAFCPGTRDVVRVCWLPSLRVAARYEISKTDYCFGILEGEFDVQLSIRRAYVSPGAGLVCGRIRQISGRVCLVAIGLLESEMLRLNQLLSCSNSCTNQGGVSFCLYWSNPGEVMEGF